ncbi:hypothetical protein ABZV65_28390 [Streptomyces bauhiniae]|uniref:hypothetical protein n=1 Tax=Streptomyces bauhiniae TaxID=2340725 RepID=UPI0033A25B55
MTWSHVQASTSATVSRAARSPPGTAASASAVPSRRACASTAAGPAPGSGTGSTRAEPGTVRTALSAAARLTAWGLA